MQHGAMISPPCRRLAVYLSLIPLHSYEVQEQDFIRVFHAIMAAYHEEIRSYDRSCMRQPWVRDGNVDSSPDQRLDVKNPDITEAFSAIGAAKDDEFAAHHVCGMVAAGFRLR